FPFGSIDDMSTLVLVNAEYLKTQWVKTILEHNTKPASFIRIDGSQIEDAMMHAADLQAAYGEGPGYRAVALPLRGQALEVLMVVPDDFAGFEASLDASRFASMRADMSSAVIELGLPRFELDAHLELTDELQALGMIHPFVDDHSFDEIVEELGVITTVVHQTVIRVDEQGTEAAAATGVAIGVTSAVEPDVTIVVDRPFLLAIRDAPTDTLLFFGRVLEP